MLLHNHLNRYCHLKGWNSNFVLLALPSQHQKKASVALYNFSGSLMRETTLLRWVRNRLNEKIYHVTDMEDFKLHWQYLGMTNPLEPEVRVVLFTSTQTTPLFYSALSVKFPGRVKFGLVSLDPSSDHFFNWIRVLNQSKITELPAYMIYTAESNYTYGVRHGEPYSFIGMERFLKSLYPCLNDIFIISFCLANAISWLELFVSNCSLIKRFKKFAWCVFKFNLMVILLWLPIIGIFQMPYLDRFPLIALKCVRILSISSIGQMLRGDYNYYVNHPALFFVTLATFLTVLTLLCKRYRSEELDREDDWFNFSQMRTLTHLRPNDFFEPMRVGGYDLFGGLDVFGSRLSQPSLWLPPPISPEYIQHLPTWKFHPISIAEQALVNAKAVEATLLSEASSASSHDGFSTRKGCSPKACPTTTTTRNSTFLASPHQSTTNGKSQNPTVRSMTLDACTVCAHGSQLSKTLTKSPRTSNSHFLGEEQVQHGKTKTDTETLPDRMIGQSHNSLPSSNPSLGVASPLATAFSPNSHTSSISPSVMPSTCSRNHHQFNSPRAHCPGDHNPGPQASGSTTESLSPGLPLPLDNQFNDDPSHSESVKMACSPGYQRARSFPVGYLENYQCVICLEEYAPLTSLCGLPCGHVFHETCIISWLNRDKHFCPMCRWPSYRPQPSHCQAH